MNPITVPSYDQVDNAAKVVFDYFQKVAGKMPNLYATIGYSSNALTSYTAFIQAQAKGTFHAKDREAIYLIVSELNGCRYCLASHTASAKKNGWSEEETLQLRAGKSSDPKWQVIYRVIKSIIENKGAAGEEVLEDFSGVGYNETALMDLMALIIGMTFTNYVYRLTHIPIDFPLARALDQ
jgi:AhpD family alkylhydroperoxidase